MTEQTLIDILITLPIASGVVVALWLLFKFLVPHKNTDETASRPPRMVTASAILILIGALLFGVVLALGYHSRNFGVALYSLMLALIVSGIVIISRGVLHALANTPKQKELVLLWASTILIATILLFFLLEARPLKGLSYSVIVVLLTAMGIYTLRAKGK